MSNKQEILLNLQYFDSCTFYQILPVRSKRKKRRVLELVFDNKDQES